MTDHRLPADANLVLAAWNKARGDNLLPPIEFAASEIPPQLLPMSMCYRRMPDGTYLYSLVGDDIAALIMEDPRGTTVLHSAPDVERRLRYAQIDRAIDSGHPFWLETKSLLNDGTETNVGRLALPATNGTRKILLVIYFVSADDLRPGVRFDSFAHWDEASIRWLT